MEAASFQMASHWPPKMWTLTEPKPIDRRACRRWAGHLSRTVDVYAASAPGRASGRGHTLG